MIFWQHFDKMLSIFVQMLACLVHLDTPTPRSRFRRKVSLRWRAPRRRAASAAGRLRSRLTVCCFWARATLTSRAGASRNKARETTEYFIQFRQTLGGPFSAVSTATIATKYSFCWIFRDLQDLQSFAPLRSFFFTDLEILTKFRQTFCHPFVQISENR